jgi:hypothetical protein
VHASVKSIFRVFSDKFEGTVEYMYVDKLGLVTIGIGNLIDGTGRQGNPASPALALPFRYKSNKQLASQADIRAEWNLIKTTKGLPIKGHLACKPLTKLFLDAAGLDALFSKRLQDDETELKKEIEFQDYDDWPADAQLGLHSMAWAMGSKFRTVHHYNNFAAACQNKKFDEAAKHCSMGSKVQNDESLRRRNQANERLFRNAAAVLVGEAKGTHVRSTLYYPSIVHIQKGTETPVPTWLLGWWSVYDGKQWYYYFSDQHWVTYTKTRPANVMTPPMKLVYNEGMVTMTQNGLIIDWNPADGGATKETFTRIGWSSQTEMHGVSNRYAPLSAKKLV